MWSINWSINYVLATPFSEGHICVKYWNNASRGAAQVVRDTLVTFIYFLLDIREYVLALWFSNLLAQ